MNHEQIENIKKESIDTNGFQHTDARIGRETIAINGNCQIFLVDLKEKPILQPKYKKDWQRMYRSFIQAKWELEKDPLTRRAMIFNTSNYYKVYPCFLSMQVLYNGKEYDLIVHQRSSDLAKLESDIGFFNYVCYQLKNKVNIEVTRLIIQFGSLHYAN